MAHYLVTAKAKSHRLGDLLSNSRANAHRCVLSLSRPVRCRKTTPHGKRKTTVHGFSPNSWTSNKEGGFYD